MICSHPGIPLQKHLSEVGEASRNLVRSKNLALTITGKDKLEQLAYCIGIAHDFGKATTYFQSHLEGKAIKQHTHHAPISSIFAYVLGKHLDSGNPFFPILSYLTVRYHHSNLHAPENPFHMGVSVQKQFSNLEKRQYEELEKIYNELLPASITFSTVFEELEKLIEDEVVIDRFHTNVDRRLFTSVADLTEDQKIELFLCCNFLFSILIDSDKKSAGNLDTDYFVGATEPIIDVEKYIQHLRKVYPEKFDPKIPINQLRNSFFESVTQSTKLTSEQYLYTITAPTGIGKTFTVFGAANELKKKLDQPTRIIYSLPFTSIIDQNFDELKKIIEWQLEEEFEKKSTKYLMKHHYLSSMEIKRDKADEETEKIKNYAQYYDDRILNESWDAGHIVTTFVQLLQSVFGYKNRHLKKFHNIVNSILILDEVQNIPAGYHLLIGKLFSILAKRFGTYIFLMTATQPSILKKEEVEELANVDELFNAEELNRVKVHCLDNLKSIELETFGQHILDHFETTSTLIVCNTKASALKLYKQVESNFIHNSDIHPYCLTTLQTPADRLRQIDEIHEKLENEEVVFCVSTQLIEAGVDLSFPVVYRDLGPFDSIAQVAGRCNRHGELKKQGTMYLVKLKDNGRFPSKIYDQLLIQYTNETLEENNHFESSDFLQLGENYFGLFNMTRISDEFLKGMSNLNYSEQRNSEKPVSKFKIIDQNDNQKELIICSHLGVEKMVEQLEINRRKFKETETYSNERKKLLGEAIELRQKLANYTISVYENQLKAYQDSAEIESKFDGKLLFVPYEFFEKGNIYEAKTGFVINPESTTQILSF